jgi:hypothetical protein
LAVGALVVLEATRVRQELILFLALYLLQVVVVVVLLLLAVGVLVVLAGGQTTPVVEVPTLMA